MEDLNFCIVTDNEYAKYIPVLLQSIWKNRNKSIDRRYNCFIIHQDLINENIKLIHNGAFDISIEFIDGSSYLKSGGYNLIKHISMATMMRLAIPNLIPDIDKILYLDIDLIVLDDLESIYGLETSSKGIIAKRVFDYKRKRYKIIGNEIDRTLNLLTRIDSEEYLDYLSNICDYTNAQFNAGVLVLSLKKLRKYDFTNFTLDLANRFRIDDQICLNVYANGEFNVLPYHWNITQGDHYQWRDKKKSIIHWTGSHKPWNSPFVMYRDLWINYSKN